MSAIRRPLVILLAATTVSAAGTAVTQLAVPWLVLQDTGNARDAGVVALCTMVPAGVSALASGGTVGRASWRRVSLVSDLACALAVGAIPLLQLAGGLDFWLLCALMATAGSCHAPGDTARALALPQLAQRAGVALPRAAGY